MPSKDMSITMFRFFPAVALVMALLGPAWAGPSFPPSAPEDLVLGVPRAPEPHTDDLPGILDRGVLRVLTTYSPSNFFIVDGRPQGFEYQLLKDYARSLEARMKDRSLPFVVQFIPLLPEELVPALLQGHGDIVANDLHIEETDGSGTVFTTPYLGGIDVRLVSHSNISPLRSLDSLSGKEVVVPSHHGYRKEVSRLNHRLALQGLAHIKMKMAEPGLTVEDILELVDLGVYGLTVADSHLAQLWAKAFTNLRVHQDIPVSSAREVGWLVRSGNDKLKSSLDAFIGEHKKGTRIGNIYFRKYFEKGLCLKGCLTMEHQNRFAGYRSLFEKYGRKYGLDWLLLAAQAYQESELRPGRVSEDGAVGLMQVMPGLARDKRLGGFDLEDVEQNVHAGAKYMKHLLRVYFNGDGLEGQERLRLALAAYNAGPNAIGKAREKAGDMGLDPGKWFGNVEKGARQLVGLEPVRYVSSINNLYVAYKLSSKSLSRRVMIKDRIVAQENRKKRTGLLSTAGSSQNGRE